MFDRLRAQFADWRQYRRAMHRLSLLDPHELRDVGLEGTTTRDIRAFVRARMRADAGR